MRALVFSSICLAISVSMLGCGGDSNPPTYPVTGKVTLDGEPVEGASITFVPDDSSVQPAVGQSDAEGNYTLTTFTSGDGAMEGSFKIQVTKFDTPAGQSPYEEDTLNEEGEMEELTLEEQYERMEQGYSDADAQPDSGRPPKVTNALPRKYEQTANSGLSYTVAPGENTFDIELTSR